MAFTTTSTGSKATLVGTSGNDSTILAGTISGVVSNGYEGVDNVQAGRNLSDSTLGFGSGADTFNLVNFNLTKSTAKLGDGADSLTTGGTAATSTLLGGGGADTFTLATSNFNLVQGGQGKDTVTLTLGTGTTVKGGSEVDTITHNAGALTSSFINGQKDADVITLANGFTGTVRGGSEGDRITTDAAAGTTKVYGDKGADVIVNTRGANTLNGGEGNDSITYVEDDTLTGGSGIDTFVQTANTVGTDASATSLTATIAAGDTISFTTGGGVADALTQISDFESADVINSAGATGAATSLVGLVAANALTANTAYYASGNYNSATGLFTITANGAGSDTLVLADATANVVGNNANHYILLSGFNSAGLSAATFI